MTREFVALDGEGVTRAINPIAVELDGETRSVGQHDYVLLAASTGEYVESYADNGLSTVECLDFILTVARDNPRAILCGFYTSYDVNMILRDVSPDMLARLWAGESWTYQDNNAPFNSYRLSYVPNRLLTVSRGWWFAKPDGKFAWHSEQSARWWDSFGFFQSSFVKALRSWSAASDDIIDEISTMKDRRGEFGDDENARIRAYCISECELLVGLMERVSDTLDALEIPITSWYGAGSVAGAVLRKHGVKEHIDELPEYAQTAAMRAYFGGRIETFAVGVCDAPVWNYDIRSAYPAAIRELPSLAGARWRRVRKFNPRKYPWSMWRVTWSVAGPLMPFPVREDKRIYYPQSGEGWYHAVEVAAAVEVFGDAIRVHEGYACIPDGDVKPFDFVPELYELRAEYKRAGDAREKILKLALNSLYGKLAQSIGGRNGKLPPYQCYYWAGYITAHCRATALRAAGQKPGAVLAIATDGVFTTEPLTVRESDALGDWESKIIEPGLLLVQPGVYLTPDMSIVRTRGFSSRAIDYPSMLAVWLTEGFGGEITADDSRFIGMGYAVATNMRWWRRWIPGKKRIRVSGSASKFPDPFTLGTRLVKMLPPETSPANSVSEAFTPRARPSYTDPQASLDEQPDMPNEGWY